MTSVDFFGIKERIVAILKADTTNLWWSSDNPSTKTKFRKIEAGAPSPKAMSEPPLPRCWVTNDGNIGRRKKSGSVSSNVADLGHQHEINFKIIFVAEAKDGPKTEEDLDDFTEAIINQLDTNYDLREPGGLQSTCLANSSNVESIRDISNMIGDRVKGREIIFKVISIV